MKNMILIRFLCLIFIPFGMLQFIHCSDKNKEDETHSFQEELVPFYTMAIGDGRSDDINRIYGLESVSLLSPELSEYTYEDGWDRSSVVSSIPCRNAKVAKMRPDGKTRVYATLVTYAGNTPNFDYTYLVEYSRESGEWVADTLFKTVDAFEGVGNQDVVNVRSGGESLLFEYQSNDVKLLELYYTEDQWVTDTIAVLESSIYRSSAGDARGEGFDSYYYTTEVGKIYEYRLDGTWSRSELPQVDETVPGTDYPYAFELAVADGLGILVKGINNDSHYYEFLSGNWGKTYFSQQITGPYAFTAGTWRTDGEIRVYAPAVSALIYEATLTGEPQVETYQVGDVREIVQMKIGAGRNDGINRIYCYQQDVGFKELTY